jgi:methylglyoxal reductase
MLTRPLADTGIEASVVGLGTWPLGGNFWGGQEEVPSLAAVHAALDAGITLVDTAASYGVGQSEEFVGKALEGRRDQVVLVTKCGLVWHVEVGEYRFTYNGHNVHRFLGLDSIRHEIGESLRRLRTDWIDVYLVHAPDAMTPIADVVEVLVEMRDQGKIRAYGVSNMSLDQVEEYYEVGQIQVDQERYNMLDQTHKTTLLPFCRAHNLAFMAYSPMAQGLLTGKVGLDRQFYGDDARPDLPIFSSENRIRVLALLAEIEPIAEEKGITLAQLALAWAFHQDGVTYVLAGSRNAQQATENAGAGEVDLSFEELAAINTAIDRHWSPPG